MNDTDLIYPIWSKHVAATAAAATDDDDDDDSLLKLYVRMGLDHTTAYVYGMAYSKHTCIINKFICLSQQHRQLQRKPSHARIPPSLDSHIIW